MVPFHDPEVTDDSKLSFPPTAQALVRDLPVLAFLGALCMPTLYCRPIGQHHVTGTQPPETSVLCREALRTRRPKQKGTCMSPEDVCV